MAACRAASATRLLLARLFALPANVLVLDEPTNDLDIDTLELLEQLLQDYDGTVFVVSHDRRFLDNVVTSTIVAEGDWTLARVRGRRRGLADAGARGHRRPSTPPPAPAPAASREKKAPATPARKLSYREQRELDALPAMIEALEAEQKVIGEQLASGDFYREQPERVAELRGRYDTIESELMQALERWEALGARTASG